MAHEAKFTTPHGFEGNFYFRVISETSNNHGVPCTVIVRAFKDKAAFDSDKHFVFQDTITFKFDITKPTWPQLYAAIAEKYPGAKV